MVLGKEAIRSEVERKAKQRGWTDPVVLGLTNGKIQAAMKHGNFLYVDHSYFKRGWEHGHFRLIRNACHLNTVRKRPDDRLKKFDVQIEPWRTNRGSKIVVIPTYAVHEEVTGELRGWEARTIEKLKSVTDRPIVVKREKGNLRQFLDDAWALVCCGSVAGVEAALMGVPVFSGEWCCSWPISAGALGNIEKPELKDRHDWACTLAYASWHTSEFGRIEYKDYDYQVRDDVP